MILSHKFRFIFVKTAKTAGTSVETMLSPVCGEEDVFTTFSVPEEGHRPRNHRGSFDPEPEIEFCRRHGVSINFDKLRQEAADARNKRFYHHTPSWRIRLRAPEAWESYFKFCIVRNPYEVFVSGLRWREERQKHSLVVEDYLAAVERVKARKRNGVGQRPYNRYIYTHPGDGSLMVDRVIRFETMATELPELLAELGVPVAGLTLGNRKQPKSPQTPLAITAAQLRRIEALYAEDIAEYGYRMKEGLFHITGD